MSCAPSRHLQLQGKPPGLNSLHSFNYSLSIEQEIEGDGFGHYQLMSMLVESQKKNHSLENFTAQLMLLEAQNKKRLIKARAEQQSSAISHRLQEHPQNSWDFVISDEKGLDDQIKPLPPQDCAQSSWVCHNNPEASPMSIEPTPMSFSTKSSLWLKDFIQQSPEPLKQSPAYHSAYTSPAFLSKVSSHSPKRRRVELPASEFIQATEERGLILSEEQELNWSGKGQHVEFTKSEELPFQTINKIGMSLTATVDKVRCRRIMLARKTMTCGRRLSIQDALVEVEHLQKLRHPHIIQLVGSYLQGNKYGVLLYPVADYDLGVFLQEVLSSIQDLSMTTIGLQSSLAVISLWNFFGCLSEALVYIHSKATKHLDIKPANILVARHPEYLFGHRVYIADFGISRGFPSLDHSQTDTPVPRTPKYCAPEVWNCDIHGRNADIFSMGCVFMEMLTTLCGRDLDNFTESRTKDGSGNSAYHESLPAVSEWAKQLREIPHCPWMEVVELDTISISEYGVTFLSDNIWLDTTVGMLKEDPDKRTLSWIPLHLNDEICSSCDGVREVYREEA